VLDVDSQKMLAARWAANQVQDGMVVGLGSGSTAALAIRALGERVRQGLKIIGVATSISTENLALSFRMEVWPLEACRKVDIGIDGADEVDPDLNLVKGLGGALLREKLVGLAARELTIIVDEGKLVPVLGSRSPVPVEVVPYGWRWTQSRIEALGCKAVLRTDGNDYYSTDNGHYVFDCRFGPIADAPTLAQQLKSITGVVEHGLFLGLATRVVIGKADGTVEIRVRQQ
jgi:ribose 5-phosphate isomerase A